MIIWYFFKDKLQTLKFAWQRAYRGYDNSVYWDLHYYLSAIAAPVLKRMYEGCYVYPESLSPEEWKMILDKMYRAMALIAEDRGFYSKEEEAVIEEGVELFGKWYRDLWI